MLKSVTTTPLWIGTVLAYRQSWTNIGKTLTIDMGPKIQPIHLQNKQA